MSDGYRKQRIIYGNNSGSLVVGAATDDTVLITARTTSHVIYVQHVHIHFTTGSAGKTWSIEDTAGSPVTISGNIPCDTAPLDVDLDYGAEGIALTQGKNLNLNVSAVGAAGIVTWEAYQKPGNGMTTP